MKLPIDYQLLSPIGTEEFPCLGGHYMYYPPQGKNKPVAYAFALKVGTRTKKTMLVKIPLSQEQEALADQLFEKFKTCYPVSVKFKNIRCYYYEYGTATGYTANADTFEIEED